MPLIFGGFIWNKSPTILAPLPSKAFLNHQVFFYGIVTTLFLSHPRYIQSLSSNSLFDFMTNLTLKRFWSRNLHLYSPPISLKITRVTVGRMGMRMGRWEDVDGGGEGGGGYSHVYNTRMCELLISRKWVFSPFVYCCILQPSRDRLLSSELIAVIRILKCIKGYSHLYKTDTWKRRTPGVGPCVQFFNHVTVYKLSISRISL